LKKCDKILLGIPNSLFCEVWCDMWEIFLWIFRMEIQAFKISVVD